MKFGVVCSYLIGIPIKTETFLLFSHTFCNFSIDKLKIVVLTDFSVTISQSNSISC